VNYARRQQYRRLSHAGKTALGSAVGALLGLVVARAGAAPLGGLLFLTAAGQGLYARRWLSLAMAAASACRSPHWRRVVSPSRKFLSGPSAF
jgi:hypothetical protein